MEEKKGSEAQPVEPVETIRTPTLAEVQVAAERLEKATAERKALLEREEKLFAMQRLGGMSGAPKVEQPKIETAKEYAERVMANKIVKHA